MDLSCNELSEITLPENLPPKLQELDLTGNPRLNLDHKTLEQLKYVWVFFFVFVFCFGGGGVFSPAVFFVCFICAIIVPLMWLQFVLCIQGI